MPLLVEAFAAIRSTISLFSMQSDISTLSDLESAFNCDTLREANGEILSCCAGAASTDDAYPASGLEEKLGASGADASGGDED